MTMTEVIFRKMRQKYKKKTDFLRAGQFIVLFLLSYGVSYDYIPMYNLLSNVEIRVFKL